MNVVKWLKNTVIGALANYCATENKDFQPMNANFGILSPIVCDGRDKKKKKELMGIRSLQTIKKLMEEINEY